ncbi:PDR/VanB family oxidoreductase [Streptomyces sp. NL15-2K]|uniref:PDR/VanB family oxidoreductase n=1 Tax=Streptomyces sp. NL15-2K TaxID=376149 RepID=UPI000F55CE28|nr:MULTISPECIES: PDR/VanB family oxidoreductase [Actinomycetes]WKX06676.1 PDR/VanB family oxidoreductase [Kutzneria buriramensis]GCB43703.1 flavodoxin reductases (ferredoxin-NADPH reductases) family 1 [Streptomyces sp. NL15-2K]
MSGGTKRVATVEARDEVAPDTVLITLGLPDPAPTPPPGSHLDVTVPLPGGSDTRSYSLVDLGHDDGLLRMAVRRQQDSRGGSVWMHSLKPGDELEVMGPFDEFPLNPGAAPSVLLAAGIGITPVLGLARALRARGSDYRIIYAGRSRDRMAFTTELESAHPGLVTLAESAHGGRVSPAEAVAGVPRNGVLYVCGPMGLLKDVRQAWQQDGRPPADLRFETFGTSGGHPARPYQVTVPRHGVTVQVPVGTSMLDALQSAGVEIMYDCLRGECGLCRVRILGTDGTVDHRDVFLSSRQRAEGRQMCACVSRIAGPGVTIDC